MVLLLAVPWTRSLPSGVTARTPGSLASWPATVAGTVAANPPTIGRALVTCPPSRRTASSGAEPAPARAAARTNRRSPQPSPVDAHPSERADIAYVWPTRLKHPRGQATGLYGGS